MAVKLCTHKMHQSTSYILATLLISEHEISVGHMTFSKTFDLCANLYNYHFDSDDMHLNLMFQYIANFLWSVIMC